MKGVNRRIPRNQWKVALLEVIGSQGEDLLPKGEIISRTAAKVGYAASPINAMALAAYGELEHEGKIKEFRPEGRGNAKMCRLVGDGEHGAKSAVPLVLLPIPDAILARAELSGASRREEEAVHDQGATAPEGSADSSVTELPRVADLARLCTELLTFFEKTGEGLIDMARTGKTLIEGLEYIRVDNADTPLERKVDRLSEQIAALSELLGVQRREFEARQAGVLLMLEAEARRRRENGAHGNSNEAAVPMSRRNG